MDLSDAWSTLFFTQVLWWIKSLEALLKEELWSRWFENVVGNRNRMHHILILKKTWFNVDLQIPTNYSIQGADDGSSHQIRLGPRVPSQLGPRLDRRVSHEPTQIRYLWSYSLLSSLSSVVLKNILLSKKYYFFHE